VCEGNSPERQDTQRPAPIGKRVLSTNPQHESVLTSKQLEKDNLASVFLLLYMSSPFIPLLSLKVAKSEIFWKHVSVYFLLFVILSENIWHICQKCIFDYFHREMVQEQQQNITKIHGGNFYHDNRMLSPFPPYLKTCRHKANICARQIYKYGYVPSHSPHPPYNLMLNCLCIWYRLVK